MCGFAGIALESGVVDGRWLRSARDAMAHRGPDSAGEWLSSDNRVALGHRRLAIVDLSGEAHQPMRDAHGDLCIAFNGEIYNFRDLRQELEVRGHRFRSRSDTEVILAAYRHWGTDCLSRLDGAFAFALYDGRKGQLLIARDRAGEKPLFYALTNDALRFSSELRGLFADPAFSRRIDHGGLDCYLAMGFVPGGGCILQGVNKLPPGHAMTFDLRDGRSRLWRYWELPALEASPDDSSEEALLDELDVLLQDAVRRQLMADVPVGILLSGGVDSSLITAMAARTRSNVKTFTVRFPKHGRHDESVHARLIADYFGTDHNELEAAELTVDVLPHLARQFDEPIADSSVIPTYLVTRMIREQCKVALGGDGGDELFGGYRHYNRLLWMQDSLGWIPGMLRLPVARGAEAFLPLGVTGRNWLQSLEVDLERGLPLIASYFDRRSRQRLMSTQRAWALSAEHIREQRIPRSANLLQRATRMDFDNYLPEDLLVKVDRASMLNSLEVRAPLLDRRVIEFAFGRVPSHLKATATGRKVLLKALAKRVLPPQFDLHRKQGFSVPLGSWLQSKPWQDFVRDALLGSDSTLFCHKEVSRLLRGQNRGRSNGERLFGLTMFELWRREFHVSM